MKHVAPHRWADLWAGRLDDAERTAMERHATACPACAKTRERVTRASDSFASIKNQSSPDLAWDAVRAKVHWSVSTERRAKVSAGDVAPDRGSNGRLGWIAAGIVAAAAVATLFVDRPAPRTPQQTDVPIAVPTRAGVPDRAPAAVALTGLVNRTTGDLMVDGIRPADPFAHKLAAGHVIATGAGRVDVQFGAGSAFGLGPHSRLQLVRFDNQAIELVVDGTIDIVVAPRIAGQKFIIRAGTREIEVRGTQFRVAHQAGATSVACRHGLVSVRDSTGALDVGAARRLVVPSDKPVTGERVAALSIDEVSDLADAMPLTMPLWDLDALGSSAPLDLAISGRDPAELVAPVGSSFGGRRAVRLDGVELGEAPMRVRVMPGRHTVEAMDNHGRYRRAGWIDVVAHAKRPARVEILPEPQAPNIGTGLATRRRQLEAGIDRGKIAACTRAAAKQGLVAGAYVQIEISVDAQGAVNFLNVLETDLPRKLSDCIQAALKDVGFRPGPAASWRERIDL